MDTQEKILAQIKKYNRIVIHRHQRVTGWASKDFASILSPQTNQSRGKTD